MHILSSDQFNRNMIEDVFYLTNLLESNPNSSYPKFPVGWEFKRKIMATVFFEPSTRTRLSFETAHIRMGGSVISVENGFDSSSDKKGESFQDCIKTISQYADLIVFRHPMTNSAIEAAEVSDCPVINAGDGMGEHPTQALLDLYTIYKEKGQIDGLEIAIVGDVNKARTIHSLIKMLKLFDVKIKLFDIAERSWDFCVNKEYRNADVIYMTRVQNERGGEPIFIENSPIELDYLKKDAIILHPLPRQGELPKSFDSDPRACYFKQVKNGVAVRQAVIMMALELNHQYSDSSNKNIFQCY